MRRFLVLAPLLVGLPAGALDIDWVYVGDPGNPPDTTANCLNYAPDCGQASYDYYISKYEITNAQYVEFLNAVAADDPNGLYNPMMGSEHGRAGGITRIGSPGSYAYTVTAGFTNKPVVYVSFWDAISFANWLHNGRPTGAQDATTTEDGAYTITEWYPLARQLPKVENRNPGAKFVVPNENEWFKAAYYDPWPKSFFDYPTGTTTATVCAMPTPKPNRANCGQVVTSVTDVGSYTGSASPYGTFDQGGNVWEWNETYTNHDIWTRGIRGGSWQYVAEAFGAPSYGSGYVSEENDTLGFRVARPAPEPAQVLLALTGGLVLAAAPRKRRT